MSIQIIIPTEIISFFIFTLNFYFICAEYARNVIHNNEKLLKISSISKRANAAKIQKTSFKQWFDCISKNNY
jgi:hypothetical protein